LETLAHFRKQKLADIGILYAEKIGLPHANKFSAGNKSIKLLAYVG
jgi:hypothetical protein